MNRRFKDKRCEYCGDIATTRDHIIPRSYLRNTGKPNWRNSQWVYACSQCNSILSNHLFFTVSERARYLLGQYRGKHRRKISPERLFTIANCAQMPGNAPSSASEQSGTPSLPKPQKRTERPLERRSRASLKVPPGWRRDWQFTNGTGWQELWTFDPDA